MAGTERFTQRSRSVISLAHQAAERLRNQYINTEHLLLGLMNEEDSVAGRVLRKLGFSSENLEAVIQGLARADKEDFDPNTVELSAELQTALANSLEEARRLGDHYIDTEYLLLGLVKFENRATDVLKSSGVTPDQIRGQVRQVLIESGTPSPLTQPQISISPDSGSVGTNFWVRGNNFQVGDEVVIWIVSPSKNEVRLTKAFTVDDNGIFQFPVLSEIGFEPSEIGKWKIYGKGRLSGKTNVTEFELNS